LPDKNKNYLPDRASCAGILLAQRIIFVALGKWASVSVKHCIQGSILAFFQTRPPGKYVRKDTCPDKILVAHSKLDNNLDAVNNK